MSPLSLTLQLTLRLHDLSLRSPNCACNVMSSACSWAKAFPLTDIAAVGTMFNFTSYDAVSSGQDSNLSPPRRRVISQGRGFAKTKTDKLLYIPKDDTQNHPFFDKPTNRNSEKVPKNVKQTNKKTLL